MQHYFIFSLCLPSQQVFRSENINKHASVHIAFQIWTYSIQLTTTEYARPTLWPSTQSLPLNGQGNLESQSEECGDVRKKQTHRYKPKIFSSTGWIRSALKGHISPGSSLGCCVCAVLHNYGGWWSVWMVSSNVSETFFPAAENAVLWPRGQACSPSGTL